MPPSPNEKIARAEPIVKDGQLSIVLSGDWTLATQRPEFSSLQQSVPNQDELKSVHLKGDALGDWDTGLMIFIRQSQAWADANGLEFQIDDLPASVNKMLVLSHAVPRVPKPKVNQAFGSIEQLGNGVLLGWEACMEFCDYIGHNVFAFFDLLRGHVRFRGKDFLELIQSAGPRALPIVSLLSFLTGLIIAFIGLLQLQKFAADIYVADLVGLALTREMAALMVGIILAGRTGAAYAAQIGSMQVNEEVDALVSFGIEPVRFLVLPRVLAVTLMVPLLYSFACLVGILGGLLVSFAVSDISLTQYNLQIQSAVGLNDFMVGLFKSIVFANIVALSGCYRGLNAGKDASAVGRATTSAVVTAITWIVIADALFAVLFNMLSF